MGQEMEALDLEVRLATMQEWRAIEEMDWLDSSISVRL